MLDPQLYEAGHTLQRECTRGVLDRWLGQVRWRAGGGVALDVGCGDGDVTCRVLRPRLPAGVRLLGADRSSDMLAHARRAHPDLHIVTLDILDPSGPPADHAQAYDHIFSFFCLHWLQDQRQAMTTLYKLLRPGGDMLVTIVARHLLFEVYERLARTERWAPLFGDVARYVTPYQHVADVEGALRTLLQDVGFQVHVCQCDDNPYEHPTPEARRQFIRAVHPFVLRLSEAENNELVDDCMTAYEEMRKEKPNHYQLAVIHASKPEH